MNPSIKKIAGKIVRILKKHGVARAGVFGAFARGEEKKDSDVDLLIEYKGRKSLLDLIGLEKELKKALGRAVDLLTYDSLNPLIRERILREEVRIA